MLPSGHDDVMYLVTTVPHPHGHWQLQELLGNVIMRNCHVRGCHVLGSISDITKEELCMTLSLIVMAAIMYGQYMSGTVLS